MIYLKLFLCFIQVGLLSIGGGYAALPLIQEQVVKNNSWLTMDAFADLITISEMTPGPIAVNSATFVGMQIAGLPGAIVATLGLILPSFIIVLTLAYFYNRFINSVVMQGMINGLRPVVVALIASAGLSVTFTAFFSHSKVIDILKNFKDVNVVSVILFGLSFFILRRFKLNPIYVMLGCGILGIIFYNIF